MRYLLLAYHTEHKSAALSKSELEAIYETCRPYDEAIVASGHVVAMGGLGCSDGSIIVRQRAGRTTVTDGPFTEAREQVGGFFLIEAADLNEAIRVASNTAPARLGEQLGWGVEIRPVYQYPEAPGTEKNRHPDFSDVLPSRERNN